METITPEQRAANNRLGLALGAFVVAVVIGLMFMFKHNGLPKSPDIYKEMEQERSAIPAPTPSSEPAPPAAGQETR